MPEANDKPIKAFISYSWSSQEHQDWVLKLASDLRADGVDVVLDKWRLKEGHDAHQFMEQMVTDVEISKVIMVCDRKYVERADKRAGGVGKETQIISPEIYARAEQDKFVAVISELDENGKPYVPVYYKSRIHIDLSSDERYADGYEQLVRWIYSKPLHREPPLGRRPAYLDDDAGPQLATGPSARRAMETFRGFKPGRVPALREYLEGLIAELEQFRLVHQSDVAFDEQVLTSIDQFLPYRTEAIEVLCVMAQYDAGDEAVDALHRFFEQLLHYRKRPADARVWREQDADNYRFIAHELFLYAVAVLIHFDRYTAVARLLRRDFVLPSDRGAPRQTHFEVFAARLISLDEERRRRLAPHGGGRISIHSDLLIERCHGTPISSRELMQTDFVLFIRDALLAQQYQTRQGWWPYTLLYWDERGPFEIFARARSREFFEQIKPLLGIENKTELAPVMMGFTSRALEVPRWDMHSIDPETMINLGQLDTRP